jgi:GT2 family glycosyltransferase
MPTISVIIPTFYRYDALEDTVKDLLGQTAAPKQIIIVDNTCFSDRKRPDYLTSTPSTECLYVSSSCEGKVNVARNEGLRQADADYVVLLDDDMNLPEDFLENFLKVHSEGWDAVTGLVIEEGRLLETPEGGSRPFWAVLRHRHGDVRSHTIAVPSCFISMRTEMIRALGYLDEAFIYSYDDYDLGLRIWKSGYTLIHDPRVRGHHLKLPRGGSRKDLVGRKRRLNKLTAKYYFISKHFDSRAAKIELVTDFLFALLDGRGNPVRAVKEIVLSIQAFRSFPKYAQNGGNKGVKGFGSALSRQELR